MIFRISFVLLNLIFLLSFQPLCAQENSKNFGSVEFQMFYENVDSYKVKEAQQKLNNFKNKSFETLDCNQKALLYHLQGSIYFALENDYEALRYWRDSSLYYWNQCDYKSEYHYALIQSNIGNSYRYLNKLDLASEYLQKATLLWAKIDDLDIGWHAGKLLDNASFYSSIGDGYNAELIYDRVENILPEITDPFVEAKLNDMRCLHNFTLGRFEDAINYGKLAIAIYKLDEAKYFREITICNYNIANSSIDLSNYDMSLFHLNKMKVLFDKYGKTEDYQKYLNLKSIVLKRLGKYGESKDILQSKIKLLLANDPIDTRSLSYAYENMGDVYNEEQEYDKAIELYLKARDLYVPGNLDYKSMLKEEIHTFFHPLNLVGCLSQIAKTKNLQFETTKKVDYLNEASEIYEEINHIFEKNRLTTYNEVKKSIASDRIKRLYQEAVKTYLSLYRTRGDFQFLEESYKYATINKSLLQKEKARNNKIFHQYLPDSLTNQEDGIVRDINSTYSALQNEEDAFKRDSLYQLLSQSQKRYEDYIRILENKYPKYHSEIHASIAPLSIKQVQECLQSGEILLDYYFGVDSLYCFAIEKNKITIKGTSNLEEFLQTILEAREQIESGETKNNSILKELYITLVDPYLNQEVNAIKIIRDEELLKLPFEALRDESKYLVERFPISYLFSNNDLKKAKNVSNHEEAYVGFGSEYSNELNQSLSNVISKNFLPLALLKKAPEEINNSNRVWKGRSFINENATKSNFLDNSHSASILHLAMHGIINHKYPDHSALIFDDRQEESVLRLNEIYQMDLNSDLVILSSCDSGSGKIFKAEGTQSLARGFAIAGSASIVSSLWAAYDGPTAMIILEFNKNLNKGENKAVALQKAKIAYLKNAFPTFRSPKYWSNLILIGNTNPIKVDKSIPYYGAFAFGLILLIGGVVYYLKK